MKKVYAIENLCCANCAAKIEEKLKSLPEVEELTLTFATKKLAVTAKNPDKLIPKMTEIAQSVEDGVICWLTTAAICTICPIGAKNSSKVQK